MLKSLITLLTLITLIQLIQTVNIKLYDEAGYYTITPSDYGYQSSFIISMWGAGSGAMSYYYNSETYYCSGNSGAYIQMNITSFNRTFTLKLGEGGYSVIGTIKYIPSMSIIPGNYSELSSYPYFIVHIPGGCALDNELLNYTAVDTVLAAHNGTVYDCYEWDRIPNGGYGAYSPYGHEGGNFYGTPKCDGYMGSGAGYNCAYCKVDEHYSCIRPYKGGDGALVLMY